MTKGARMGMHMQQSSSGSPRIAPVSEGIAARIKQHRHVLGASQEAFARRLGVTRQTVSNWECARTIPDAVALSAIARVCNTTTDALLGTEAPHVRRCAHETRREFVLVSGIVLGIQLVTMFLNGIAVGTDDPDWGGGASFAAFRFGVLIVGGLWIYRIARREGLTTVRQMIDFASLASAHPGSLSDRALRFIGRWFWTLWFAFAAGTYAAGGFIAMAMGKAGAVTLIAPAFMLLIATIPYTWEKNAPR